MSNRTPIRIGLALAIATAAWASTAPATAQMGMMGPGFSYNPGYGTGMMGQGMMGPGMMGPGMMGPGMMYGTGYGPCMMNPMMMMMGPGMMGQGYGPGMMYAPGLYGRQGNLNLSTDDVKNYLERMIAAQGNPRLIVGEVSEKDANTIEADIVTREGNVLVQRFSVERQTGFYRPSGS